MSNVQIVTCLSTGSRYILRHQMNVGTPNHKVYCWGELSAFKGLSSKHTGEKVFLRSAVEISDELPKTRQLLEELWDQGIAALRAKGLRVVERVSKRGNINATIYRGV